MRQKEQRLWDTMRKHAPDHFWLQRVENVVMAGMPDVYAGGKVWVELKAPTVPIKESTRLLGVEGLNPAQINWHLKAYKKGTISSWILIRDSRNRIALVSGGYANMINDLAWEDLDKLSIADCWMEVFELLEAKINED